MNMNSGSPALDWSGFLGRPPVTVDLELAAAAVSGRSVLITGAGGSIGSGLARAALRGKPRSLALLDISETALYASYRKLPPAAETEIAPVIGSVADRRFLDSLFQRYRPETIFHAAAYKHLPLMEKNPFSAFANNALGTYTLALAAAEAGVARLVSVSTDKAVNPSSAMGASKRIAELAVLSHSTPSAAMSVARLCNVLGSSGSVAPLFEEQARLGLPLTVTDEAAERYFIASGEAEAAILRAAASEAWGRVLLPNCGEPVKIVDLARYIAEAVHGSALSVEFIGLRPGEKLREELWSSDEAAGSAIAGGLRTIATPVPPAGELSCSMKRLQAALESFRLAELAASVAEILPGYRLGRSSEELGGSGSAR